MWRRRLDIHVAAVLLLLSQSAFAQSRLALVIGNSQYQAVTPLANPLNDAKAVAEALTAAQFQVTLASDLSQIDMRRAVRDFSARIAEKGADTIALVFYAGHGLQVEGENFLVPVDARIQRESDIAIEALRLADVMKALEAVQSRMRIVILDACRNNPFSAMGASGRGLAIVDAPTGTIVGYSTAPGTEAEDGKGDNSPFTSAFLKVVREPGLAIEHAFKRIRLLVHEATAGRQTPWESSSLTGDFAFYPEGGPLAAAAAGGAPLPEAAGGDPQLRSAAGDPQPQPRTASRAASWRDQMRTRPPAREAYEVVVMEDSVEAYEEFIIHYPEDPLADRIRRLLSLRAEAMAWRHAVMVNTPAAYGTYLASYPGGDYANEALRLRERPRLRPIDPVIAPRVVVAPPPLRVSLPPPHVIRPASVSPPIGIPGQPAIRPQPIIPGPATVTLPPKPGLQPLAPKPGPATVTRPPKPAVQPLPPKPGRATVSVPPKPTVQPLSAKPKPAIAQPPTQVKRPLAQAAKPPAVRPQGAAKAAPRIPPGCAMQAGRLVCPPRR